LRYDSFVQLTARKAAEDIELGEEMASDADLTRWRRCRRSGEF
jgi:hypothetical protein